MQFQIGKLSYNKEQPPLTKDMLEAITMADSALYTHYSFPYYNPSKLYEKKGGYDLYDDMREDDQISAVLNLMKYIILSSEWEIDCDDEKISKQIEENFNSLDEVFIKKLYNILSSLDYGFSLTEIILKQEDGKIVLDKLKTRMPHNFDFALDDYGNIINVIQSVKGDEIGLNIDKFIHFVYQGEFDNPYGRSAMNQGVYKAYWSKSAIIKFWNIYLERHGMPFGVGTYPKTAGEGSKADLREIGANIQAKTFATLPEGFDIQFREASKGTDNYEKAIDKYNMMIARAMLVPDLLGFSGSSTGGGSYALGEKQFDMFYTIVEFLRKQLQRVVTQKLVRPLVFFNFGANIKAEFVFNAVDKKREQSLLEIWLSAVNGGKIPVTDEHINWFLQRIEAPTIDEKQLDEIRAKREEISRAIQGREEEKEEEQKEMTYTTRYEKKVDFAKIEKDLDQTEDKYREELGRLYKLSVNALVDEIKRKQLIEKKKFKQVNELELKHQGKINLVLKKMLRDAYEDGFGEAKKEYLIDEKLALSDEDIAEWLNNYAFYVSDMEAGFILGKVKSNIMGGIQSGAGVKEIMNMIDNALAGYDMNLGDRKASRIETIARTTVSTAYNEGRTQQFINIQDDIQAYQFSSVLDGRTSNICERLNGKILKPNEISLYQPPLHFNCRSLLVPVFTDEEFDGDFNIPTVKRTQGNFVELA